MPRLRTVALAAVVVVVLTDVTWDGTALRISVGWPGRAPIASFVFRRPFFTVSALHDRATAAFIGQCGPTSGSSRSGAAACGSN